MAITHAIDKQFLVDVALEGYGTVAVTLVNDTFIAAPKNIAKYAVPYDVKKAKKLLEEAGQRAATAWSDLLRLPG